MTADEARTTTKEANANKAIKIRAEVTEKIKDAANKGHSNLMIATPMSLNDRQHFKDLGYKVELHNSEVVGSSIVAGYIEISWKEE